MNEGRDIEEYDFSSRAINYKEYPFDDYKKSIHITLKCVLPSLFEYGNPEGDSDLIEVLKDLLETENIFLKNSKMIVTSGTQQALQILLLSQKSKKFLIEQPTYSMMNKLISALGNEVITMKRNVLYFNLEEFEAIVKKHCPDFVYLMPRIHNPLDTSMSREEKKEIVKLAEKYNFYIIEDDYLGDYENDKKMKHYMNWTLRGELYI